VARAFSLFADIPEASIKVLPNPISSERIHLLANESLPLLPFLGEDPYWVAVGRLHPQKGFELLIRAFARFSRRYPDSRVHLLLLGEGPQRPRLEILIRQLGLQGKVHLLGHVPNPYPYMRRARGLLLASRYEGLPTVVLEALVLGVPVLATEAEGGLREALGNGSFGLVVPRTLEALAEGMVRLWRGEINLSAQTLADHLAVYTLSAAVKAYTNLFEEIWS
jgi:glycosyltransferase involved in cell wall biosynthesis